MPPLVVPDGVQVRINWHYSGQPLGQNVLHFDWEDEDTVMGPDATQEIGAAIEQSFNNNLASFIANEVSLETVGVRDLRTPNEPEFLYQAQAPGTAVSDPLPLGTALCLTLRTGKAGRSYRGRVFLPGWSEGTNTSTNRCALAAAVAAQDFLDDVRNINISQSVFDLHLAVLSRKLLLLTRVDQVVARDLIWDTQRRRNNVGG